MALIQGVENATRYRPLHIRTAAIFVCALRACVRACVCESVCVSMALFHPITESSLTCLSLLSMSFLITRQSFPRERASESPGLSITREPEPPTIRTSNGPGDHEDAKLRECEPPRIRTFDETILRLYGIFEKATLRGIPGRDDAFPAEDDLSRIHPFESPREDDP